jgi:hypothetical protein
LVDFLVAVNEVTEKIENVKVCSSPDSIFPFSSHSDRMTSPYLFVLIRKLGRRARKRFEKRWDFCRGLKISSIKENRYKLRLAKSWKK